MLTFLVNSEDTTHCLPLPPPLASLIWCLSHRHEGGCAWPLILSPPSPSPKSFHCLFLPAPVPLIFASSSGCRAPSELSLQATFRPQSREASALALQLQGPACAVGQRGCRTGHTRQQCSWELLESWEHGQTDPSAPGV